MLRLSSRRSASGSRSWSVFLFAAILVGCGVLAAPEHLSTTTEALGGSITISGQVFDANGLFLSGVTVTLAGSADATQTSDANGKYAFSGLSNGSYSVRPTLNGCSFMPDVVNLNNLTASITENLNGSGTSCGGSPTVNAGAMTGAFAISGHLRDGSGDAILGGKVTLSGGAQGIRFSDFTGAYSFNINSGSYSLTVSSACSFNPSNANLNNVTANKTQDFTASSAGCITATQSNVGSTGSVLTLSQNGVTLGTSYAHLEQLSTVSNALARLQEIVAEQPNVSSRSLTIAGNPAIERQVAIAPSALVQLTPLPTPPAPISLTAAIAVGSTVIRFESRLPGNATAANIQTFFQADRNFSPSTTASLHGPPPTPIPLAPAVPSKAPPPLPVGTLAPSTILPGFGELQIAASDSANAVVYGTQSAVFVSTDGGQDADQVQD
jgi:hypothetical protein